MFVIYEQIIREFEHLNTNGKESCLAVKSKHGTIKSTFDQNVSR